MGITVLLGQRSDVSRDGLELLVLLLLLKSNHISCETNTCKRGEEGTAKRENAASGSGVGPHLYPHGWRNTGPAVG